MPLIRLALPTPAALRGGWAALAAVCAAQGWTGDVYATPDAWFYHDGGGNWVILRFLGQGRAVLLGNDHEYSQTYFGAAATYFGEEETDLLKDAPAWWREALDPSPLGEWIGFVYGWDGTAWHRADYTAPDGFDAVGLLRACSLADLGTLQDYSTLHDYTEEAPGLTGSPNREALAALVRADGHLTPALVERAAPGWDAEAGARAGRAFLARP